MKKWLSMLLTAAMLMSLLSISAAAAEPYFAVSDASGFAGEEIEVTVSLKNNSGFGGMAYDVLYDNALLELVSYERSLGSGICTDSGKDRFLNKVNFQYSAVYNIEGDGVLVKFVFRIIGNTPGTTEIKVVPEEGTSFYYDGQTEIDFTLDAAAGVVRIKDNHTHQYGNEWKHDDTNHWHECACGDRADVAAHTFGNWKVTTPATETTPGEQKRTRTACSYQETQEIPAIGHNYGTEWKHDGTNHWHECACGDKADVAAHTFGNWKVTTPATETTPGEQKRTCTVCDYQETQVIPEIGHTHNYGTEWKNDSTNHWHECACGDKSNVAAHVYDNQDDTTCNICGYICTIPTYSVKIKNGGSGAEGTGNYREGATVTVNAGTKTGYSFAGWTASNGAVLEDASSFKTSFIMPAMAVTLTANWKSLNPSEGGSGSGGGGAATATFSITAEKAANGTVTLSKNNAAEGATVTMTVQANDGYELQTLTVLDESGKAVAVKNLGGSKYSFEMPASKVKVAAVFVKAVGAQFADVSTDFWAFDAIMWAKENGYINGNSLTTFNPGGAVTRQQLWMILARMAGAAPANMAEAKAWAVANGISDGSNPVAAVSRQQMVTILYRYTQLKGYDTKGGNGLGAFPDAGQVAGYAKEAMDWSVTNGIVGGTAQGTLNPTGTANRAQFATILKRFSSSVVK